jgi:hypothetical protein
MFLLALCAFDGIALLVAIVVVWRLPFRGCGRELSSIAVACGLLVLAVTLGTLSSGGFAVMRGWAHAVCCVALPALALRAVRLRRRSPWLALALALVAVGGEGLYVWAREVEPRRLEVTTATVASPRLAALTQPVRVACVADLQTDAITAYEVAVFDRLVELQPDLVLFLGDYLQLPADECAAQLPALHAQLRRLQPRLGMFAVDGDVDGAAGGVDAVFAGTSVQVLVDAHAALPNVPIDLYGLSRMRSRAPLLDAGLVRRLGGERFPIVLGHAPDFMLSVLRGGLRTDALMVAGHTHGGQVQVPGFGPLVTLSSVPRWLAAGGVFQQQGAWLVCSRGIGMERGLAPQVRFCCRPQLIVLELRGG